MSNFLILAGIAIVGSGMASGLRLFEKIGRKRIIATRPILSDEEIFSRFYANTSIPRDAIIGAWYDIGKFLNVDYGKLRPDDRLEELIGLPKWLGSDGYTGLDDLQAELVKTVAKNSSYLKQVRTIDDAARILSKQFNK